MWWIPTRFIFSCTRTTLFITVMWQAPFPWSVFRHWLISLCQVISVFLLSFPSSRVSPKEHQYILSLSNQTFFIIYSPVCFYFIHRTLFWGIFCTALFLTMTRIKIVNSLYCIVLYSNIQKIGVIKIFKIKLKKKVSLSI